MNEQQTKYFEEIIIKAVQQGKQETSGLVEMVIHKIEPAIEKAVEKHVNGKIRALDYKIDEYIKHDLEWKAEITPQIESVKEFKGWGKVTLGLLGFLSAIGGCILLVINLFKNIK